MAISARAIRAGAAYVELLLNDSKLVRGLQQAQKKLKHFGTGVKKIGKDITLLGAGMVTPFAASVKIFTSFADAMAAVQAKTFSSAEDFKRLSETAKRLGATTSFSATEAANGMEALGAAGFKTEQILAGIGPTLQLARAGAMGLGEAADVAVSVMGGFGMAATDIQKVSDVLAQTANASLTGVFEIGETMKYASSWAKTAGQSIEDTGAAIALLANRGVKGTMAGTDLAIILKALAGGDAVEPLRQLGIETTDAAGNIRSIVDVMEDLGRATQGMDPSAKIQLMNKAFERGAKSAIALSDAGQELRDLQDQINNSTGAVGKMAGVMENTVGGSFREFSSAVEGLAIAVGESLEPTIRKWAQQITANISTIGTWVSENQGLIVSLAKITAGVIAGGAALYVLGTIFSGLSAIVGLFTTALTLAGTAIALLGTLAYALATPVGAIVGAIGVAIIAFTDWGAVGQSAMSSLGKAFQFLKSQAQIAFGGIQDALAAGDIPLAAEIMWVSLKIVFRKGFAELSKMLDEFLDKMVDGFASVASFGIFPFGPRKPKRSFVPLKEMAEQQALIEKAQKLREARDKKRQQSPDGDPGPDSNLPDFKQERQELEQARKKYDQMLADFQPGKTPDIGSALGELENKIEVGAVEFDTFMGQIRNTALELGTAEAQSAIIDAITGRNDPQKELAKNTKTIAENTKKTQKDVAKQTDLMRQGVRLIVENA